MGDCHPRYVRVLGTFNLIPMAKIPTSYQDLRAPASAGGCHFIEIFWSVDVVRDTRQCENNARKSSCLGCGEMRQKTIVPKAQRKQISRRSPSCICAATSRVWCKNSAPRRRTINDLL